MILFESDYPYLRSARPEITENSMHYLILPMTLLFGLLSSQTLAARPFEHRPGPALLLVESQRSGSPAVPSLQRLDSRAAASRVKQRYQNHKILSIRLSEGQGPGVFRVKTLSPQGVVKYVFVDAGSGNVFE